MKKLSATQVLKLFSDEIICTRISQNIISFENFALKVFVCVNELKSENHTLVVIPEPRFDFPSI